MTNQPDVVFGIVIIFIFIVFLILGILILGFCLDALIKRNRRRRINRISKENDEKKKQINEEMNQGSGKESGEGMETNYETDQSAKEEA